MSLREHRGNRISVPEYCKNIVPTVLRRCKPRRRAPTRAEVSFFVIATAR